MFGVQDSGFEVRGKRQLSWSDVASHLQKGLRFRVSVEGRKGHEEP